MGGPFWLTSTFAALMLTVAVYCAGRIVVARWWRRPTELDSDGAHVFMGVAMAGMLVTGLRFLPAGWWEAVFAVGAVWFGGRMLQARRRASGSPWRCPHPAPHLVECVAMLYMFLVLPAAVAIRGTAGGMGAMSVSATESRFSFVALLLALFMFGYVVWVGDRLQLRAPALALAGQASAGPRDNRDNADALASASNPTELPGGAAAAGGCAGPGPAGPGHPYLAPRCAALCKMAMGITMGYMLILML